LKLIYDVYPDLSLLPLSLEVPDRDKSLGYFRAVDKKLEYVYSPLDLLVAGLEALSQSQDRIYNLTQWYNKNPIRRVEHKINVCIFDEESDSSNPTLVFLSVRECKESEYKGLLKINAPHVYNF